MDMSGVLDALFILVVVIVLAFFIRLGYLRQKKRYLAMLNDERINDDWPRIHRTSRLLPADAGSRLLDVGIRQASKGINKPLGLHDVDICHRTGCCVHEAIWRNHSSLADRDRGHLDPGRLHLGHDAVPATAPLRAMRPKWKSPDDVEPRSVIRHGPRCKPRLFKIRRPMDFVFRFLLRHSLRAHPPRM